MLENLLLISMLQLVASAFSCFWTLFRYSALIYNLLIWLSYWFLIHFKCSITLFHYWVLWETYTPVILRESNLNLFCLSLKRQERQRNLELLIFMKCSVDFYTCLKAVANGEWSHMISLNGEPFIPIFKSGVCPKKMRPVFWNKL